MSQTSEASMLVREFLGGKSFILRQSELQHHDVVCTNNFQQCSQPVPALGRGAPPIARTLGGFTPPQLLWVTSRLVLPILVRVVNLNLTDTTFQHEQRQPSAFRLRLSTRLGFSFFVVFLLFEFLYFLGVVVVWPILCAYGAYSQPWRR